MAVRRVTAKTFWEKKAHGEPIAMVTAYDFPTARLLDAAGVDGLLVGDSLGMVVQGEDSTVPVTMAEMLYHTRLVSRGAGRALVVADMPFGSYQAGPEQAVHNAVRLLKAGAQAVKLEGGTEVAATVARLTSSGIPVMGHIGLTPQSVHALGGFTVQGRTAAAASRLLRDALALEEAGAFAVVVELVPWEVAAELTARVRLPTIGIGAGAGCDGQVQVFHDLVGWDEGKSPRHAKRYAEVGQAVRQAAEAYVDEVRRKAFPSREHAAALTPDLLAEVRRALADVPAQRGS